MRFRIYLILVFVTAFIFSSNAQAAFFQGLGDLSGGSFNSRAHSVSGDGSVVVGSSTTAIGTEAFIWTRNGGMVSIGSGKANAISSDGSTVVGVSSSTAFRWTSGSGMVSIGPAGFTKASDVSADGSVIVGHVDTTRDGSGYGEAFRWTSTSGMVTLGLLDSPPTGYDSYAHAVSADGLAVVGETNQEYGEPFRYTAGTGMVGLGYLAGTGYGCYAYDVSADGSVVVGMNHSGSLINEAFIWTEADGMIGLGHVSGGHSAAFGISSDGTRVVGKSGRAFLWDSTNGMQSIEDILIHQLGLDLTGWQLTYATEISADGQTIVGYGINPDGNTEAWVANITVPIPGALWLFGSGLLGLVAFRKKRMHCR